MCRENGGRVESLAGSLCPSAFVLLAGIGGPTLSPAPDAFAPTCTSFVIVFTKATTAIFVPLQTTTPPHLHAITSSAYFLGVGAAGVQGGVHHRGGDKVRLQDGDDLAGHPGEHPCGDVVRAHHCRLDVL